MTITATPTTVTAAPTTDGTPVRYRGRRVQRGLLALLTALLMSLGTVMVATPASASGGVYYCFKHTNGATYQHETYLQLYYNGGWNTVHNLGRVPKSGCSNTSISGWYQNYPARVLAYTTAGSYVWTGVTPYSAAPGAGWHDLGTGWVYGR